MLRDILRLRLRLSLKWLEESSLSDYILVAQAKGLYTLYT